MIRKPMLYQKILRGSYHREVIGLIGAHPGAGVTYTGLMLAFYLGETLGRKTAYLECSGHHDFILLQQAYLWSSESLRSFSYGNITFHKEVMAEGIPELLGEAYDCVILDFGHDLSACREEFPRCSRKLVLGGWTEWNCQKLGAFIGSFGGLKSNETWNYLIPFAGNKVIRSMQLKYNRRFYPVPLELDPMRPSKETGKLFHRFLS